ncbi:Ig-like domain repeat protein [Streptomyces sp. NPDC048717]|uniref:RCC1 domain-containing protein n=1 Tax=Streptomyces sp. NPDC048717 TaxID=3154928 RepID=UPI003428D416
MLALLAAALCLIGPAAPPSPAAQPPTPARTPLLLGWGLNRDGQVGDGSTTNRSTPVQVRLPAGVQVASLASKGEYHSVALTTDGRVFAWGYNGVGQLGDGTTTSRSIPIEVHIPAGVRITAVSTGYYFSMALTSEGRVLTWGNNTEGQLGDGTTTARHTPVEVHLPAGTEIAAISGGGEHATAVTTDGRVLAWGRNTYGQLGNGASGVGIVPTPVQTLLPAGTEVALTSGGGQHTLALTTDGRVLAWGRNNEGQLGDNTLVQRTTPVQTHLPAGTVATGIAAGGFGNAHGLALTSEGRVLGWGRNNEGQVGDGTNIQRLTPVDTLLPAGVRVTEIAAGSRDSIALTSEGRIYGWGQNANGELGDGTTTNRSTPVQTRLPAYTRATTIGAGEFHTLAAAERAVSVSTLTASPTTAAPGQPVTLTAEVACSEGTPTGTVEFRRQDGTVVGTAEVGPNGTATLVTSDLGEGQHTITAYYLGDDTCPPSTSAPVTVTVTQAVSTTTLTASPTTVAPGDPVTLTAQVTCNVGTPTGTVEFFEGTTSLGTAPLGPDGTATLTTTDLALGSHHITAHYLGDGTCPPSVSGEVVVVVEEAPHPSLGLDKRVESTGPFQVGDTVAYAYTVTNTGNLVLGNVTVTDDKVTGVVCDTTTLAPGENTTCHGGHRVTEADITPCRPVDGGCALTNLAQARALEPTGNEVASEQATATLTVERQQTAELTLVKRVESAGPFRVGDTVAYAYTVTNTGNLVLGNVTVTDDKAAGVVCDTTTLAPGESTTCRGSHTITQADVTPCRTPARGGGDGYGDHEVTRCEVTNTAHAAATDPQGGHVTSNQATATITVEVNKEHEGYCDESRDGCAARDGLNRLDSEQH